MTQTKVTLTLDMEECLDFVRDRLAEAVDDLASARNILDNAHSVIFEGDDSRHALIHMDVCRQELAKIDRQISEYMSIVEGHYDAENTPDSAEPLKEVGNMIETLQGEANKLK